MTPPHALTVRDARVVCSAEVPQEVRSVRRESAFRDWGVTGSADATPGQAAAGRRPAALLFFGGDTVWDVRMPPLRARFAVPPLWFS